MGDLRRYREKRDPERTPEPFAEAARPRALPPGAARAFVVQQHAARRLHYDLRLEIGGVLASWAVPKGPSLDPRERRLAVRTEDHPLAYADFEGVIPAGNYGAGAMIVWDRGVYRTVDGQAPAEGLEAGKLDLVLAGHKLRGRFALVRTRAGGGRDWLLLRKGPGAADALDVVQAEPASVLSGLSVQELRDGVTRDAEVQALLRELRAPRRALAAAELRPMLASTATAPFSREGWIFELKYDGVRVRGERRADGSARIVARSGGDRTRVYPEIARALAALPLREFALDGEIVAQDESGRSSFERLQRRFTQSDPAAVEAARAEIPVVLQAFDLLSALGCDLRGAPLVRRKQVLTRFVPRRGFVRFSDHVEGDGMALFEAVRERGLEGVVAKRADSRYEAGRRSKSWLKIKAPRTSALAIVGISPGRGSRASLGALLLAWCREGELCYAGSVGSGLDARSVERLSRELHEARVAEPAFRGAPERLPRGTVFVRPERVCEVRYTEVTSAGLLRQPVFLRLLEGRDPMQCLVPAGRRHPVAADAPAAPARRAKAAPSSKSDEEARHADLELTRLDKVFWPIEGYTKGELLAWYEAAWPFLAPYLRDRPVVLTRYPDGIEGKHFYQKNAPEFTPAWVRREPIDGTDYFVCNDLRTLLYVVNSGAIPLHVWSARVGSLDRPDWLVIDLDPKEAPFAHVVRLARELHRLLGELGAPHFVKTSGQDGLHVLLPLGGRLSHDEARSLAEVLARVVCAELPEIATVARPLAARGGRVYVDFLQNGRGKLIAAPYSVRPRPGAPVSTPLAWSQVTSRLDPSRLTIRTALERIRREGDPMQGLLRERVDVRPLLAALAGRLR
jgi:bifunctional non-homologous end joining protein LigD